jgi:hypothetical protein
MPIIKDRDLLNDDGSIPVELIKKCIDNHKTMIDRYKKLDSYYDGMQIMGGSPCYYADFGYDYSVHTEDDGFSASSLLRLVFTDFPNNKKGVHIYNAPLVMHNHINLENNVLYTDSKRNDSVFSTDKGTYIGSEKMISFGVVNPNEELYHNTYLTLNNRAIANSVGLDAYC